MLAFLWTILELEDASSISTSFKCSFVSNILFWTLSLIGLYADHLCITKKSLWLTRCKLQPSHHLSSKERVDLVQLAAFNMIFVMFFVCCPLFESCWDFIQRGQHHHRRLDESDAWQWQHEVLFKLPIHAILSDISFYAIHRALHHSSFLYKSIHKVHHRFSAPTAMACVYAHPLEFVFGNILPIFLGPMLTNAHPFTCYALWFPMAMVGTLFGHCGYDLFCGRHVDPHDVHHSQIRYNYGGMCLMDYIFGTLKK